MRPRALNGYLLYKKWTPFHFKFIAHFSSIVDFRQSLASFGKEKKTISNVPLTNMVLGFGYSIIININEEAVPLIYII